MLVKEQTGVIVIDLKPMLELRNMTPYKLSQLSRIDKDTIYKYVNGQVLYRVDLFNLAKICHILKCELHQIMWYEENGK